MKQTCDKCKALVQTWNTQCGSCGFHLVMEPDEALRERFLKRPSLGALLFTQGWTFGARLYGWFLLSLVPVVGFVVLGVCFVYGNRLSWKRGGWASWQEYEQRMRRLDQMAVGWICLLVALYVYRKLTT